ncbi:hypothetical protein CspeluHIS016_0400020 [Cutaneotrichosporon spelunceum]|uniref:Uncharacterized protein n=1 Tax=Cutaneotrichosporon spelunceum TaxID=1672016 RepID=A0AAD3TV46_9TREE|nr:hypothetical protein CspeluHIS016_0400020 [Cutaneotrichosporon spelunceum]
MTKHGDPNAPEVPKSRLASTFSTGRQIFIFCFYIFYLAFNIAFLGMVSDQLHRYGNVWTNYPDGRWYHSLGLGLFIGIFFTMVGMGHAWLNHPLLMFCHFAGAVMSGVVAGLFTATPFGHGLQCSNPVDSFPAKYQPFLGECRKITAITALAWTMFGLNTLALFWLAVDGFSCTRRNTSIYVPWEPPVKVKDEESEAGH